MSHLFESKRVCSAADTQLQVLKHISVMENYSADVNIVSFNESGVIVGCKL